MKKLFWLGLFFIAPALGAEKAVLVTGYWPPTNEMLGELRLDAANPSAWRGKNWRGLGYDVYAYFPDFPEGSGREGRGDFRVDFTATYNDFMRLTQRHRPAAILSFGQGGGPWEIEGAYPAHFTRQFQEEKLPSKFAEPIVYPIPASLKEAVAYPSTLPMAAIEAAVNDLPTGPRAWIDPSQGPGDFLCGFLGYLGAWYQARHPKQTYMSGFIHVGAAVTEVDARNAAYATLEAVILRLPR